MHGIKCKKNLERKQYFKVFVREMMLLRQMRGKQYAQHRSLSRYAYCTNLYKTIMVTEGEVEFPTHEEKKRSPKKGGVFRGLKSPLPHTPPSAVSAIDTLTTKANFFCTRGGQLNVE